ncbi:MAG: hypothetical protein K2J72_11310, partial [Oscillospiraceae bacterium]|nr:hypothetical protein [Oscillospiraceae bacterium]
MNMLGNIIMTAFTAVFAENIIFSGALGTSTLIIVSRSRKNLLGFGLSVTYITALMSVLTFFLNKALKIDKNSYIYAPLVYIIILGAIYI